MKAPVRPRVHARWLALGFVLLLFSVQGNSEEARVTQGEHRPEMTRLAGIPLSVSSAVSGSTTEGAAAGVFALPFSEAREILRAPEHWCGILILHFNVKGCVFRQGPGDARLNIFMGTKDFEALSDAEQIEYTFTVEDASDALAVNLRAARGPLGTTDYLIELSLAPSGPDATAATLSYRYAMSKRANLALRTYLKTRGRHKVGFTITGQNSQGAPVHIAGLRGLIERNVVRYYLATLAYLDCVRGMEQCASLENVAERWFELTERFPTQLHELERSDYLRNKRQEIAQQVARQDAHSATH